MSVGRNAAGTEQAGVVRGVHASLFSLSRCHDESVTSRWRTLNDEDREREYSPSSCVGGNIDAFLTAYAEKSANARADCAAADSAVIEVRYGAASSQTIDLVVPTATQNPTPLLVFIHGGYWQALSKLDSFFAAPECLSHGVAYAAVDYTLAPHASLDEIVDECRLAVRALRDAAPSHNIDPQQIIVSGSSAGAHLTAMVGLESADAWRPAAIALVSGVYELEPLIGLSINEAVQLDTTSAHRNSPIFADLEGVPPTLIAYGHNETAEFKAQSDALGERLIQAGVDVVNIEIPERNHFDIVFDLCDEDSLLGAEIFRLTERVNASLVTSRVPVDSQAWPGSKR